MPMAITITTDKIYNAFYDDYNKGKAFMHSHTYSGNPLGCSAAVAVQKVLKEEAILENAKVRAEYLNNKLNNALIENPHIGEIRHIGLINAMELVTNKKTKKSYNSKIRIGYEVYKKALNKGLILRPLGNVLYFNPPLIINEEEIDKAVSICKEAIEEVIF
jgi:adenosylmethionine-8-amino-7-oxononanoate aminotransferase